MYGKTQHIFFWGNDTFKSIARLAFSVNVVSWGDFSALTFFDQSSFKFNHNFVFILFLRRNGSLFWSDITKYIHMRIVSLRNVRAYELFLKSYNLYSNMLEKIKYEFYEIKRVSNYWGRGNVALKQSVNQSFDFRENFVVISSNFDENPANLSASLIFKF